MINDQFPEAVKVVPSVSALPTSKNKKIFSIAILLILLCVAGVGVYAYYPGVFASLPFSPKVDSVQKNTTHEEEIITIGPQGEIPGSGSKVKEDYISFQARQKITSDLGELFGAQAMYFNNSDSISGFCLSKQASELFEKVKKDGGTELVCKDAQYTFAIGVKIPYNPGYWCMDSTSSSKATSTLPTSTACPNE